MEPSSGNGRGGGRALRVLWGVTGGGHGANQARTHGRRGAARPHCVAGEGRGFNGASYLLRQLLHISWLEVRGGPREREREREREIVCVRVCASVEVGVGFEFVKHSLRFH